MNLATFCNFNFIKVYITLYCLFAITWVEGQNVLGGGGAQSKEILGTCSLVEYVLLHKASASNIVY